jgi:membrane-bound lytic murein transglycosylase D
MLRTLLIRITALGAGLTALVLFLLPGPKQPEERSFREWWENYFPTAQEQAEQLSRLERAIEPEAESVPRPVPTRSGNFEVTEGLRTRVDFWKRIYSDINSYQAIVHDSSDLKMIYALVDLRDEPGVDPNEFHSVRSAALQVLRRYRDHLKYLTTSRYDPERLAGERLRLYQLLHARGGTKQFRGADRNVRIQRGLRDLLQSSIIRSGLYFPIYREIFEKEGLPAELIMLPHLESAFNYEAQSSAGAVGIWQLTRSAARPHLHISAAVDERIDPWRSAEVAALLLKDNYRQLGSWPLAVTAYNQGTGAMKRAIRQVGNRDIEAVVERYHSRSFGFAGRNFYAAFLAVLEVVDHYELHYGPLPIEEALKLRRHRVPASSTLKAICNQLGIEPGDIELLNPALRKEALRGSAPLPRGAYLNLPPSPEKPGS